MEDQKERIKELRNTLRTTRENTRMKRGILERAQEEEGFIQVELEMAIRDCEHQFDYSAVENDKDEDGGYLNNTHCIVTRLCTTCGIRETAGLNDTNFMRHGVGYGEED
jgi:hypothetical protein